VSSGIDRFSKHISISEALRFSWVGCFRLDQRIQSADFRHPPQALVRIHDAGRNQVLAVEISEDANLFPIVDFVEIDGIEDATSAFRESRQKSPNPGN
jgi:hypothetical protein